MEQFDAKVGLVNIIILNLFHLEVQENEEGIAGDLASGIGCGYVV